MAGLNWAPFANVNVMIVVLQNLHGVATDLRSLSLIKQASLVIQALWN